MLRRLRETTPTNFVPVATLEGSSSPKFSEKHENAIRKLMETVANYAESGPTFDPSGKYLCGTCNQRSADSSGRVPCATVSGQISLQIGGCRRYYRGKALGSKLRIPRKASQLDAGYGERPKAKGFGCSRCEYAAKSVPDSQGRNILCKFWGARVKAAACCDMEDGKDLINAPGDKKEKNS